MNISLSKSLVFSAVALAALSGCSAGRNQNVEHAQERFTALKSDPVVLANAPAEIIDAEIAVNRARRSWEQTENSAEAKHLSYVAERKIDIARVKANKEVAEDEAASLSRGRDRALLDARTDDARRAAQDAQLANAAAAHYAMRTREQQAQIDTLRQNLSALKAKETSRGLSLTLGDVLFETDRSQLKPGAARNLSALANFLKDQPNEAVAIEGHTDNVGTSEYNRDLSQRRAEAVRDFLVTEGVSTARINARGLSEKFPLTSNSSDAGRLQNRRVEIIVSNGRVAPGRL